MPNLYVFNACLIAKPQALQQLEGELVSYNIDAALISETHLKQKHTDKIIQIAGYNIIRRDRIKRRAGGVAIVLKEDWNYTVLDMEDDDRNYEILWVRSEKEKKNGFWVPYTTRRNQSIKPNSLWTFWNRLCALST